ncbi:MAG: hypothetical protein ACPGJS_02405 [Flammeovirgaceae bacterium]
MKKGKYYTLSSIIISTILILLKLRLDYTSYHLLQPHLISGDISPSLVAGGLEIVIMYYLLPMLISIILSIVGIRKKNTYCYGGLALSIVGLIYLIIPMGILISLI